MAAGGRIVHPTNPDAVGSLILRLTSDAEAETTGREVVQCVRTACVERDLEAVSTLHALFRDVVCRVPEFHVLLAELFESDRKAIAKVLRFPARGAGRPRSDEFQFVALLEYVMNTENFDHVTEAIDWLVEHRAELVDKDLPTPKTLQNMHSKLATYFRLWSRSMYVPPDLLTLLPPLPPGVEHDAGMVEKCRYPPRDGSPWPYGVRLQIRHPKK